MKIKAIDIENVKDISQGKHNYIFGASDTGKILLDTLQQEGVAVRGIWDNDTFKQGKRIHGVEIISYEKLCEDEGFNLFIACAYVLQEESRIQALKDVSLFQVGKTKEGLKKQFAPVQDKIPRFVEQIQESKKYYKDEMSVSVVDATVEYMVSYHVEAMQKVVSAEEHYFIAEVMERLPQQAVFVDCGAFTAEFPGALKKQNIHFGKCYCFEMEEANCSIARQNVRLMGCEDKVEIVHGGVAGQDGYLYFESNGASSKLVDYETQDKVQVFSLDTYFQNTKIDFIKMDIEGAELGALKGGMHVIKRDRPILAVSVYHSLEDRIEIPRYLQEQLGDYDFYLRQHSIWFSETVLYAVPR